MCPGFEHGVPKNKRCDMIFCKLRAMFQTTIECSDKVELSVVLT